MDYGELQDLVLFYLHRTDMQDKMNGFFELARERIAKDARIIAMQTSVDITFDTSVQPLPEGYIEMIGDIRLNGSRKVPLQFADNNNFDRLGSSAIGGAMWWTMRAGNIEVAPFAGSVESPSIINATYYQKPAKLTNREDTNSISDDAPTLYLFAVLAFAHNAIQDLGSEQVANQNYMGELNKANESAVFGSAGSPTMFGW
jgi:hypothetical protein